MCNTGYFPTPINTKHPVILPLSSHCCAAQQLHGVRKKVTGAELTGSTTCNDVAPEHHQLTHFHIKCNNVFDKHDKHFESTAW